MAPVPLKKLTALQDSRAAEIRRIHMRFVETTSDSLTRNIIEHRLSSIDKVWDEARATHAEIVVNERAVEDPYMINDVFAQMETTYESSQNDLLRALSGFDASSSRSGVRLSRQTEEDEADSDLRPAKLPKLDLPTFSGQYEDWEDFCDLFTSLVHDAPRLASVTKLQYLKSCLTGTAADLVKDVTTTNANYLATWQALKTRFSNPRLIVSTHLTALMELPYLKKESAVELRAFSDEAQRIVRALTNLGMPVQHWDVWLVHILASRLDPESRRLWETDLSMKDRQIVAMAAASAAEPSRMKRFPKFSDFVEFLEQRSHALGMIAAETKANKGPASASGSHFKSNRPPKRVFHVSTGSNAQNTRASDRKCSLCSENHYIGNCSAFLSKSPFERRNVARRLRLCYNCLGSHKFQKCESKYRCKKCRDKHHSSLHTTLPGQTANCLKKDEESGHVSGQKQPAPSTNVSALTSNLSVP